jgi:hypothetical protein
MLTSASFKVKDFFLRLDLGSKCFNKKFISKMEHMSKNPEKSIHGMSKTRSEAKSTYRMLLHNLFDSEEILHSHRAMTSKRAIESKERLLLIQDTTSVSYNSKPHKEDLGFISSKGKGINLHSTLAVNTSGVVYGLMDQKYYNREEAKDTTLTPFEKKNRAIYDKESYRWFCAFHNSHDCLPENFETLTICDREGDFYEFMHEITSHGGSYLIRVAQDRLTDDNKKLMATLRGGTLRGVTDIVVPRQAKMKIEERLARVEIRYEQVNIKRPVILDKYEELSAFLQCSVIHVVEDVPEPFQKIEWFLITCDPITSLKKAIEYVNYYKMRWLVERFHYVLKSGCNIEKIQARTMEVTTRLILLYSIISIFIMNLTYQARVNPETPVTEYFDEDEWKLLHCFANKTPVPPVEPYNVRDTVKYLSWLGGPKRAPSDGPPGLKVVWEGLKNFYLLYEHKNVFTTKMGQV